MASHIDEYYCLASVKGIKSFASAFPDKVVLISQDDKAKVFYLQPFLQYKFSIF